MSWREGWQLGALGVALVLGVLRFLLMPAAGSATSEAVGVFVALVAVLAVVGAGRERRQGQQLLRGLPGGPQQAL